MHQLLVNKSIVKFEDKAFVTNKKNREFYYLCKRCLDVILSSLLLVLLSPLFLLIAILIKLDSDGPVIFVQGRVGARRRRRHGQVIWEIQTFALYKFRSMVRDADESLHQAHIRHYILGHRQGLNSLEKGLKVVDDPRITRVGRIIRKTSLDELPQLANVLKGEMSLVGPRPVPTYEFAEYQPQHYERLAAWSGITGLWQVKGRSLTSFEEQIDLDVEYIRRQSLWLDLKILLLTLPAVLSGRGAV